MLKANGGRSVVVRFAHEASGNWFPWSIGKAGNTVANYKAAWRRIDRIFRQAGARNHTKFLWSNLMPSRLHYPGDRYVDYVGSWGPMIVGHAHPAVKPPSTTRL